MSRKKSTFEFTPSGFFAFRSPLLPYEELERWADDLQAARAASADSAEKDGFQAAIQADRDLQRKRLGELLERPEIQEALFVASPSLGEGLESWRADPDSKKGRRAEEAIVRYFQRMTARATPFGLFSGCSLGRLGKETKLELSPRQDYQRHTRLDMDYIFALCEDLGHHPQLRQRLRYWPNSSLYEAAGRLRYAESRLLGKSRSHHLVAVENADYLQAVLDKAAPGATMPELVQALVDWDPDGEVTAEEAVEFITELIDGQILVNSLSPPVTGPEPIHDLIRQLEGEGLRDESTVVAPVLERLRFVRDALHELDSSGLGSASQPYLEVARRLEELPTRVELPRLFQVDMVKPAAEATLSREVLTEIENAAGLLARFSEPIREDALSRFRQEFQGRYEDGRPVPLLQVLDEEVGIGFDANRGAGAEAAPLLDGIAFVGMPGTPRQPWGNGPRLLLRKLERALAEDAKEIEISDEDLELLGQPELSPLPDAFQAMASIAAESAEAVDRGEFQLYFKGLHGPSGARLLGRFCHADEELQRYTERHMQAEEALAPDAIFAEVVHLPEGRLGNILSRPVMRQHEIPFLGRGGADVEHQIPVSDLLVTVIGQRIVLYSESLGKRVIPRLTSAHNYSARSLGVYRFLCTLQQDGRHPGLGWSWGPFEDLAYLPRVTRGRLVLSRARWNVRRDEIVRLTKAKGDERFRELQKWRQERQLPRQVVLVDGDNELLIDLESVLAVESFLALIRRRPNCLLNEPFPADPQQLCVQGPEGRFINEIIVPYVRKKPLQSPPLELPKVPEQRRIFTPGSEWLYLKIYSGTSTVDRLLAEVVGPLARQAVASGAADRWFFIRYGDPDWHLRLRLHGEPQSLNGRVLPALASALEGSHAEGRLWRLQVDTYEREIERYGGDHGIALAEQVFWADSEAVLDIVSLLEGDEGARARWQLALTGTARLLEALLETPEQRLAVMERMQRSFATEFRVAAPQRKQLADRLRQERGALEQLLAAEPDGDHPYAPGVAILERRSQAIAPAVAELRELEAQGKLSQPLVDLAPSFVHMYNNRLLRSEGRAHEVVLYDFLFRITQSQIARQRKMKKSS